MKGLLKRPLEMSRVYLKHCSLIAQIYIFVDWISFYLPFHYALSHIVVTVQQLISETLVFFCPGVRHLVTVFLIKMFLV